MTLTNCFFTEFILRESILLSFEPAQSTAWYFGMMSRVHKAFWKLGSDGSVLDNATN